MLVPSPARPAEKALTIVHTNDLHSHLLGHSPNRDYTPDRLGDDETLGGWARVATVIKLEKLSRTNPVLVLDAGDFLMGSLFHMISRDEAAELVLMKEMGYDITTLGNHEFDLRPDGLARILRSAERKGKLPEIVSSNLIFDETDPDDDSLEAAFDEGLIKPYIIMERDGIKIGFFGLVGYDAAEVAPFASPVTFEDMLVTSERMVKFLREEENVDMVICISHSGLREDKARSEDEILAESVPGIDIIISGHSHTVLTQPIIIGDTIVVQAGEYGKYVGILDVTVGDNGVRFDEYELVTIDDTIKADPAINRLVESYISVINKRVLDEHNLTFDGTIAETDFDLVLKEEESGIGNLVADSVKWAIEKREYDPNDPLSSVDITIQSNGLIRTNILMGTTGFVSVSDLFRVVPLGIGMDGTMSYPLVTFYLYGSELKKTMEVPTSIYPLKGSDYFLQFSGLHVTYNPRRMIFDRVTEILIEDENGNYVPLDYSDSNKTLYRVASNIYNSTFIKVIGNYTNNILTMVPKDRDGNPIDDLTTMIVDADPQKPGIQELKDWTCLMEYVESFEDTDNDGVPEIPARYSNAEGRFVRDASINPYKLLKRGNYLTWIGFGVFIVILLLVVLIVYVPVRIMKKRRKK
jgi:5'-nucleotidase